MLDESKNSSELSKSAGEPADNADVQSGVSEDADKTQALDCDALDKTQSLAREAPTDTTRFEAVGDATVSLDDVAKTVNAEEGTRSFPAVISNDDMAPDMTVMLSEQFSELVDKEAGDSLQVATAHKEAASHAANEKQVAPGAQTEVLPFTRKYFEQYESDEGIPEEALHPQTEDESVIESENRGAHSIPVDPKKKRRRILIAVIIALLIIAGIVGFFVWRSVDAHRKAIEPHAVQTHVTAPGYDSADSKIPVHIEGASSEGVVYDEVMFIDVNGNGIELPYGDYTLSIAASPLLDTPELYSVPDTRIRAQITDTLKSGETFDVKDTFMFTIAALVDIKDEDIINSYTYALESGLEKEKADKYKDALVQKRDAELAVLKAEQEKQQRLTDAQNALTAYAESKGRAGVEYKLIDISGNGLPELLLAGNSSSSVGSMAFVCSYDPVSHRVTELASAAGGSNHEPSIWYSTDFHQAVLSTKGTNRESFTFYTLGDNRVTESHTYIHETRTREVQAPSSSSSSASSGSSSTGSTTSQQSPTTTVQVDTYSYDGSEISAESYNAMINELGSSYLAIWAPSS